MPGGDGTHLKAQYLGGKAANLSEFEANLIYKASSRTAGTTQRNLVSQKQKKFIVIDIHTHTNIHTLLA